MKIRLDVSIRRREIDNMDNKIYVSRQLRSECNTVKCYYDVVDRKFIYKATKMFTIVKPSETLIFQPVFTFTMDTLDKINIDNMRCELYSEQHGKNINVECKYTRDGEIAVVIPYVVYKVLSVGKIYSGRLYNGYVDIEFQYEVVMDCNGN